MVYLRDGIFKETADLRKKFLSMFCTRKTTAVTYVPKLKFKHIFMYTSIYKVYTNTLFIKFIQVYFKYTFHDKAEKKSL